MTVRDVVMLAAENLGRSDLADEAKHCTGAVTGELASLLNCYNLVENQIALDYYRLKREETFTVQNGRIEYSKFIYAPIDVIGVTDSAGKTLEFKLLPDYLQLAQEVTAATVLYAYSPTEKTIHQKSAFSDKLSTRLIAYGVTCEKCMQEGRFQEAAVWEDRFVDALRNIHAFHRNPKIRLRARRWA